MSDRKAVCATWRVVRVLAGGLVLTLGACSTGPESPGPEPGDGAIQVGPDVYQVPIGRDPDGCVFYRLYSPTRVVPEVISYRRADGTFTRTYEDAACAST